jgi:hypothetical protein
MEQSLIVRAIRMVAAIPSNIFAQVNVRLVIIGGAGWQL